MKDDNKNIISLNNKFSEYNNNINEIINGFGGYNKIHFLKLFDAITLSSNYKTACNYAGIPINTFYDWLKKGKNAEKEERFDDVCYKLLKLVECIEATAEIQRLNKLDTYIRKKDVFALVMMKYISFKKENK